MIGLHTLEAATGAAGTTAMRLFMPGKPVGTWRNVVIRQDRSMPLKTKALSRATGGRVIGSSGYYFHEGGRTWMCASYTLNVNGTARTLTKASTLAYPKREYFFYRPLTLGNSQNNGTEAMGIGDDAQHRELPIQRVVDVVKGVTYPEQVPGYIGSTNELENIIPLGGIKRSLLRPVGSSWTRVNETQAGGIGYADYQAAMSNNGNSSTHIYRRLDGNRSRTGSGSTIADYSKESLLRYDPKTDQISVGDGKGNQVPIIAMANSTSGQPVPLQAGASRSSDTKSDTDDQLYYWGRKLTYAELSGGLIKHFVEDDNGIPRPLLLRNVIRNPLDNSVIPDAIYCDGERCARLLIRAYWVIWLRISRMAV